MLYRYDAQPYSRPTQVPSSPLRKSLCSVSVCSRRAIKIVFHHLSSHTYSNHVMNTGSCIADDVFTRRKAGISHVGDPTLDDEAALTSKKKKSFLGNTEAARIQKIGCESNVRDS